MGLISILISIYNEKIEWIDLALRSMLSQTYQNIEIIIIIDNPNRTDLIKLFQDVFKNENRRSEIIYNSNNIGLTKSLNLGLNYCKGDYIARMDADDISFSTRLEKQMNYLISNPTISLCGTGIIEFDDSLNFKIITYPEEEIKIKNKLILEPAFAHPTLLINRRQIEKMGYVLRYDENYLVAQDYKLYADFIDKIKFGNLSESLLYYRRSPSQITAIKRLEQIENAKLCRRKVIKNLYKEFEKKNNAYYNLLIVNWLSKKEYKLFTVINFFFSLDWRFFSIRQILAFMKRVIKGPSSLI